MNGQMRRLLSLAGLSVLSVVERESGATISTAYAADTIATHNTD
jgi:hypothetical protein